jgi:hypothetical protein
MCHDVVVGERHNGEEPSAVQVITIGLDLAKHWVQVHRVDVFRSGERPLLAQRAVPATQGMSGNCQTMVAILY